MNIAKNLKEIVFYMTNLFVLLLSVNYISVFLQIKCKSQYENVHNTILKMRSLVHMDSSNPPEDNFHRWFLCLVQSNSTPDKTNIIDFPCTMDNITLNQGLIKYDYQFDVSNKKKGSVSKIDTYIAYKFTLQLVQMIKKLCSLVTGYNESCYARLRSDIEKSFVLVKTLLSSIENVDKSFYQNSVKSIAYLLEPCFLSSITSSDTNQTDIESQIDVTICELAVKSNCDYLISKYVVSLIEKLRTTRNTISLIVPFEQLKLQMTLNEVYQVND